MAFRARKLGVLIYGRMVDFSIDIKQNNTNLAKDELKDAINKILYIMGTEAVAGAVEKITSGADKAVDTGRLRASISFVTADGSTGTGARAVETSQADDTLSGKAEEKTVYVGSNVSYAFFVHEGTRRMGARPFLRDGIMAKRDSMQEKAKGVLEGKY